MSDSEQDASVLGKRSREGENGEAVPVEAQESEIQEDSDEDVGPMPMPAGAEGVMKKKRKGACILTNSKTRS